MRPRLVFENKQIKLHIVMFDQYETSILCLTHKVKLSC